VTAPALSEFEALVQRTMVAASCSREKAELAVRRQFPYLAPKPELVDRAENVREKEEQAFIAKLFRGFGCKVYNLSQARASKQTPGLPDLWVISSWRDRRDPRPEATVACIGFWFEVKRASGGVLSEPQRAFRLECEQAGIRHYVGDRRAAAKLLVDIGLARVGDGPCGIVPFHEGR
jgi:hypothetical protein